MRKPTESVLFLCHGLLCFFILIAWETHLKRWQNVTVPLENREEHYGWLSGEPWVPPAVIIKP